MDPTDIKVETKGWEKREADGVLCGQISVTITEDSTMRDARDGAVRCARELLTILESMQKTEVALRTHLQEAQQSFHREREAHSKTLAENARLVDAQRAHDARMQTAQGEVTRNREGWHRALEKVEELGSILRAQKRRRRST